MRERDGPRLGRRAFCRAGCLFGATGVAGGAVADRSAATDRSVARSSGWWRERTAVTGATNELTGNALALGENRALVGVPLAGDPPGTATASGTTGAVIALERTDGEWRRDARIEPTAADDDLFGARIALDGDRALIGAPSREGVGTVAVVERTADGWRRTATLTPSQGADGDQFGSALALGSDWALVGAPGMDVARTEGPRLMVNAGAVYAFERTADGWQERSLLKSPDVATDGRFGAGIVSDGNRALIGAPLIGQGRLGGLVAVVERTTTGWETETTVFGAPASAVGRAQTMALQGDTAVLGAEIRRSVESNVHTVRVIERTSDGWSQTAELDTAAGDPGDFGRAVALDGDRLLVGAPGSPSRRGPDTGAVYAYRRTGDGWRRLGRFAPSDATNGERFGFPLVLRGDDLLVGAIFDSSARLFERVGSPPETTTPQPATRNDTTTETTLPGLSVATGTLAALAGIELLRRREQS